MTRPVIVGGGWAGLAAAVELADAGLRPRLLEAGPRLGGRAATLPSGGTRAAGPPLDHGQHLLIGAYTGVEALLKRLDIPLDDAFARIRPGLRVAADDGSDALALDLANLPAPLHSLVGITRLRGLSVRERWRLVAGTKGITPFSRPRPDETVAGLLRRSGQSPDAHARLWTPLCLATLNTPPAEASAALFSTVLHEVFRGPRRAAELWFPLRDLGALLAEPARTFIEARGGEVLTNHRVRRLVFSDDGSRCRGVASSGGEFPGPVVLAVAPWHAARLLRASSDGKALKNQATHLEHLKPSPIDTVYLQYPEATRLEGPPLLGFEEPPSPWLIDRRTCGQPGWFGLAVSAPGPLAEWSREQLAEWATNLVARARPDWPAPLETVIIREKRATFSATPEAEHHRPQPGRAAPGLWLAGDHTATGLPATLEGAVRSGVQCARQLIREGH